MSVQASAAHASTNRSLPVQRHPHRPDAADDAPQSRHRALVEAAAAVDLPVGLLGTDAVHAMAMTGDRDNRLPAVADVHAGLDSALQSALTAASEGSSGFGSGSGLVDAAYSDTSTDTVIAGSSLFEVEPAPASIIGPLAWVDRDLPAGVRAVTDDNDEGVLLRPTMGGIWTVASMTAVGLGAVAAASAGGSDDDTTFATTAPAVTETGGNAEVVTNEAPVGQNVSGRPASNLSLTSVGSLPYSDAEGDALQSITITGFNFDHSLSGTSGWTILGDKAFVLQTAPSAIGWWAASQEAQVAGGQLAWIPDDTTMDGLLAAFGGHFSGADPLDQPGTYLQGNNGDATFIGLAQETPAAQPTDGWRWLDANNAWGPALENPGYWYAGEPNDLDGVENSEENIAALIDGSSASDRAIIIDQPDSAASVRYLVELDLPLRYADGTPVKIGDVIAAADIATLKWSGAGLDTGSFSYTMTAASGTQSTTEYTAGFRTNFIGLLPDDQAQLA